MITIPVATSKAYEVKIGAGLLSQLGNETAKVCHASRVAIISDDTVWPLYGEDAKKSLISAGFDALHFVFPAGESSKNGNVYLEILNFLAENKLTRSDCLIALGGGVVGDMTGFVAATYLRGIAYIQVPTTLLAAVDSSVGGKTAIDLPAGKNLAGAFYQPKLVLCDTNTLNTLPEDIFRDGCAEVIKYGILYDPELFSHLLAKGLSFQRDEVIAKCVSLKRNVVIADEFDRGDRMKLNLGHTIGHGVEANSNYMLSHGKGVAIGIAIVTRAAAVQGICSKETTEKILAILEKFQLPTKAVCTPQEIYNCTLSDKKRSGDTVNLIVPREIGDCQILPTKVEDLYSFIEAGM